MKCNVCGDEAIQKTTLLAPLGDAETYACLNCVIPSAMGLFLAVSGKMIDDKVEEAYTTFRSALRNAPDLPETWLEFVAQRNSATESLD